MEQRYKNFLRRKDRCVVCVKCSDSIGIRFYQKHLRKQHGVETGYLCIWCMKYTWKRRNASKDHYEHRFFCMLANITPLNLGGQCSIGGRAVSDEDRNSSGKFSFYIFGLYL